MVIDFENIPEAHLSGFKGGKGFLDTRNFVDDHVKIMYSTLRPGASSGLHTHKGNSEIIFVISGTLTFHYDDEVEICRAGQTLPITMLFTLLSCRNITHSALSSE